MTRTNLPIFQEALRIKQDELTQTRRLENIAIEGSADERLQDLTGNWPLPA
jgi:hypothetical protein